jgi:hypothetical protein
MNASEDVRKLARAGRKTLVHRNVGMSPQILSKGGFYHEKFCYGGHSAQLSKALRCHLLAHPNVGRVEVASEMAFPFKANNKDSRYSIYGI